MGMSQLILYFQVAAAVGFTPTEEMERVGTKAEKGAKDFFKVELVENLNRTGVTEVLGVVVVRVGVVVVVEGTQVEAVGLIKVIPVEEGEVPIMLEKISKVIAVTMQLVMAM